MSNTPRESIGETNEYEVTSSTSIRDHSVVWDYFARLPIGNDGVQKASCNACGKVYSVNPNSVTSHLKRHIPECFNLDEPGPPQKRIPLDQATYRENLAIAIIEHNYPFSFVEHEATRQLHRFLNVDARPITRHMAKAEVFKIYEREKTALRNELENIKSRICLTSSLWSSITSDEYMILTAHYVDNQWVLRKKVLNVRVIPPPLSGSILAENMLNFLADWGIQKKVSTITLDNAKHNDGLVESLKDHLRLDDALFCDGDYIHVCCGAHVFGLIVIAGIKVIEGVIEKVRESVKYVRGNPTRKCKFAECIANFQLQCKRHVRQDIVTRWSSTYLMLDSALAYRRAYTHLQLVDPNFKTCPSDEEWIRVEKVTKILKPFHDIMSLFSGSSYPTSNIYFISMWKIQLLLQEEIRNSDPLISSMVRGMKTKFDENWETCSQILSFAFVLDPRYKLKAVGFCFSKLDMEDGVRLEKVRSVRDGLYKLYNEYEIRANSGHDSSITVGSNVAVKDTWDDYDDFESFQSEFDKPGIVKSQLDRYLEEPLFDRRQNIDVLQFWRDNRWRFPELTLLACDILSIPITTAGSESSFSVYGRIISKYQLSSNVESLLCSRDWLFDIGDEEESDEEELKEDFEALIPT